MPGLFRALTCFKKRSPRSKAKAISSFVDTLDYEPTGTFRSGRAEYRLTQSFTYEVGEVGSGLSLTVPKGFVTDFASIPRGFRWAVKPIGKYSQAAALHDYLYLKGVVSRQMADMILREAMIPLYVPFILRWVIYYSVRAGGWRFYDRKNFAAAQIAHNDISDDHKILVPKTADTYTLEDIDDIGY